MSQQPGEIIASAIQIIMILSLNNLSATISSSIALSGINLQLEAGTVTAIIGPNGAGKTSLLRTICKDLPVTGGSVSFNGRDNSAWSAQDKATCLAILPQHSALEFPFSVNEVVTMGRIPHSTSAKRNQQIVQEALILVDREHLAERSYVNLSGGEKQRVQLARVAAQIWESVDNGGRCLILDEPSASLDLAHQEMIVRMFKFFSAQGVAILVVLHDLNLAAKCANQLLVLNDGKTAALGSPESVITQELLKGVFSIDAKIQKNPLSDTPMVVT